MVVLKRYANRRLYDTRKSSYITLDDVASYVRRGESLQVVDAKTGDDLTRRVLTQVVLEQARRGDAGPPLEFLRHLILAADDEMQDFLNWYLGQALDAYRRMKKDWRQGSGTVDVPPSPGAPKKVSTLEDQMDELRRRMEEMEHRLKG